MSDNHLIDEYLQQFAWELRFQGRQSHRVIVEVEDHLREAVHELRRQGFEPEAAATRALERFGSPSVVLRRFELEAPLESEVEAMVRYLLIVVAGLTTLLGALFFVFSWFDDAPPGMLIAKLVAAVLMVACGALLFHQGRAPERQPQWLRGLMLAAALMSIMMGSAGGVFTVHLGLVTHDWEMYGFVVAGVLILQGVLAAVGACIGMDMTATCDEASGA